MSLLIDNPSAGLSCKGSGRAENLAPVNWQFAIRLTPGRARAQPRAGFNSPNLPYLVRLACSETDLFVACSLRPGVFA